MHTFVRINHQALDVLTIIFVQVEYVFRRHVEMAFKELMKYVIITMTVQVEFV